MLTETHPSQQLLDGISYVLLWFCLRSNSATNIQAKRLEPAFRTLRHPFSLTGSACIVCARYDRGLDNLLWDQVSRHRSSHPTVCATGSQECGAGSRRPPHLTLNLILMGYLRLPHLTLSCSTRSLNFGVLHPAPPQAQAGGSSLLKSGSRSLSLRHARGANCTGTLREGARFESKNTVRNWCASVGGRFKRVR